MNPVSPCWMRVHTHAHPLPKPGLRKPSASHTHTFQVVDLTRDRDHLVDGALVGQPRQWTRRMVSAVEPRVPRRAASGRVRRGGCGSRTSPRRSPGRRRGSDGETLAEGRIARAHPREQLHPIGPPHAVIEGRPDEGSHCCSVAPDPLCQRRQANRRNHRYPHPIPT
ncbi:hypothetical protein RHA1_ro08236 (plasmid) [Rhodococcus jostii RHA1]|uniref:Uncharacterized protein n=1 Tax=Rhodococcus jostii (strain RHA1) TaxID=101510 RepID=Q0RZK5_RHOJR|nr:hypothetical protein RHA1_ro08236 [Rhodococcus jostii RHA1]